MSRLDVLDILPTREVWRRWNLEMARRYWHWTFHLQPDLPERLVGADVAGYLGHFFERWTYNRSGLDNEAVAEYVRAFCAPDLTTTGRRSRMMPRMTTPTTRRASG